MTKIDSTVSVIEGSKLAVEMVSNGWSPTVIAPIAAAFITISVIVLTTILNFKNSKKMLDHQSKFEQKRLKAEHEDKVSEFRHEWLKEVRSVSSELYRIIEDIHILCPKTEYHKSEATKIKNAVKSNISNNPSYIQHMNMHNDYLEKVHSLYSLYLLNYSKLNLLFKSSDSDFSAAIALIHINEGEADIDKLRNADARLFISKMQVILKNEWEVTKTRSWNNK